MWLYFRKTPLVAGLCSAALAMASAGTVHAAAPASAGTACQPGEACDDGLFCTMTDVCVDGQCVGSDDACPGQVCDDYTDTCKAVRLELRPEQPGPFVVGDSVPIGLYAVSQTGVDQPVGGLSVILAWDPTHLALVRVDDNGPYPWVSSGFPDDSGLDGLNNTFLDGDALYEAWGFHVPNPVAIATAEGLLVTTLEFHAAGVNTAQLAMLSQFGATTQTRVLDGETIGQDITGTLGLPVSVEIVQCVAAADCDDGEFCNGVEQCVGLQCATGTEPNCDDGVFCNGPEQCESGLGCVSLGNPCPDPASCDEGTGTCGGCEEPGVVAEGSRYIAVAPAPSPSPVAILVKGAATHPAVSCVASYVQPDGTLDATPAYQLPAVWETVHVTGAAISPNTAYIVHTDCRYQGAGFLSSATAVTTWTWGDVNHDGMVFLDDLALVVDGSQGVFEDASLPNVDLTPCQPDGIIDGEDIAAVENAIAGGAYSCPAPCEACMFPGPPPAPEPAAIPKTRYLSFVPGQPGERTALRVTLVDLPPPFEALEGETFWVDGPVAVSENGGDSDDSPPPTFMGASLACEPVYRDWSTVGLLHVSGGAMVPEAVYEVQAIRELCHVGDEAAYSEPLQLTTSRWGDVADDCEAMSCGPPDGDSDFNDITAIVDKFRDLPGALIKARADIAPDPPDRRVDFVDIPWVVDAFRGVPYRFDGPDVCP